ncbi:hypothetical protein [Nostoc sp.]|uniref:hypothetical protein n=1 Tax=Nostoc sp. TaxID=1180 RepID=UPI002FF884F8
MIDDKPNNIDFEVTIYDQVLARNDSFFIHNNSAENSGNFLSPTAARAFPPVAYPNYQGPVGREIS